MYVLPELVALQYKGPKAVSEVTACVVSPGF